MGSIGSPISRFSLVYDIFAPPCEWRFVTKHTTPEPEHWHLSFVAAIRFSVNGRFFFVMRLAKSNNPHQSK
jgi:hypothetical protein